MVIMILFAVLVTIDLSSLTQINRHERAGFTFVYRTNHFSTDGVQYTYHDSEISKSSFVSITSVVGGVCTFSAYFPTIA